MIVIAGNCCDVDSSDRQVSYEQGAALANELNVPFYECSAKTGKNVVNVFESWLGSHSLTPPASSSTRLPTPGTAPSLTTSKENELKRLVDFAIQTNSIDKLAPAIRALPPDNPVIILIHQSNVN